MRARPLKSLLTAFGIVVGACALVVMLGLTGMNAALLQRQVTAATSTEVEGAIADEALKGRVEEVMSTFEATGMRQVALTRTHEDGQALLKRRVGEPKPLSGNVVALSTPQGRDDLEFSPGSLDLLCSQDGVAIGGTLAREAGVSVGDMVILGGTPRTVLGILERADSMPNLLLSVVTCLRFDDLDSTGGTTQFRGFTAPGSAPEVAQVLPGVLGRPHRSDVTSSPVPDASLVAQGIADSVVASARYVSLTAVILGVLMLAVVMNTMVIERLPSYSLKKSLGASRPQIITEVLVHGAILGLAGGLLGLLIGILVLCGIATARDVPAYIPLSVALLPLGSMVAGAAAGLWPAWRAASADPINFLRD